MSGPEAEQQQGFAQRLSPLIAAAGVVALPDLLLRFQARLGLTSNELVYLAHILSHRWDGSSWPWVAVSSVATATGKDIRNVRSWKESLQKKGLLICRARTMPTGGRVADEHDISPLFARLEALALELHSHKAIDKLRSDLPQPTFFGGGLEETPQLRQAARLSTSPRGKNARALQDENARGAADENALGISGENIPRALTKTPAEKEPGSQSPVVEPGKQSPMRRLQGERDDSRQAKRRGGGEASANFDAARALVSAFYCGLGADPAAATPTIGRRDLAIAQQLASVGATPEEAEAYARDMCMRVGRLAPVDLRSFERERLSWGAQRRGAAANLGGLRLVTGTGLSD